MQLGERIRRAREARGLTQADVAAAMGQDQSTVAHWESGRNKPSSDKADKLADLFAVTTEWLLYERGPGPQAALRPAGAAPPPRALNETAMNRLQPATAAPYTTWPRDLPVRGHAAGGGKGCFFLQGEIRGLTYRHPSLTGVDTAYALYVEGDSNAPRYEHGEMVWVHPERPARARDWVVLQIRPEHEGDHPMAMIARLKKLSDEQVVVEKLSPPLTLRYPRADVLSLHVIVHGGEAV